MNRTYISGLLLLVLCCCGCATKLNRLSLTERLQHTDSIFFCKEDFTHKSERTGRVPVYPTCEFKLEELKRKELLDGLRTANSDPNYPLIGHLAHLLLLDKWKNPIAIVSIVNWDCVITIYGCHRKGETFYMDDCDFKESASIRGRDEAFAKEVYSYMKAHMPDELASLQKFHQKLGENMEELLFHGQSKKQKGAP